MPTVAVEGTRFYYEERGSGPPLLLIHGTGGNTAMFTDVVGQLAGAYRVISYDRRGFTRTEAPALGRKGYLRRHADDAAGLLRELGAPSATVVGWSMGGVIALALALQHPKAVSRLVLYEPPLHAKKHMGVRVASALGGALGLAKMGMVQRGAKRFFRFALAYNKGGNAFDELEPALRASALANASAVIAEMKAGTGEELSRTDLATIKCPVGIISGARSADFLREAADRCASIFPSAKLVRILNGDHVMNIRQPAVLARAIEDVAPKTASLS